MQGKWYAHGKDSIVSSHHHSARIAAILPPNSVRGEHPSRIIGAELVCAITTIGHSLAPQRCRCVLNGLCGVSERVLVLCVRALRAFGGAPPLLFALDTPHSDRFTL